MLIVFLGSTWPGCSILSSFCTQEILDPFHRIGELSSDEDSVGLIQEEKDVGVGDLDLGLAGESLGCRIREPEMHVYTPLVEIHESQSPTDRIW